MIDKKYERGLKTISMTSYNAYQFKKAIQNNKSSTNNKISKLLHPMNCKTCDHYKWDNGCIALAKDTSLIDVVGCASHSNFKIKCHTCGNNVESPMCITCYSNNVYSIKEEIYDNIIKKIIEYLDGSNCELDCNTTDAWYGYGWDDSRVNLIECIKNLSKEEFLK